MITKKDLKGRLEVQWTETCRMLREMQATIAKLDLEIMQLRSESRSANILTGLDGVIIRPVGLQDTVRALLEHLGLCLEPYQAGVKVKAKSIDSHS